MKRLLLTRYSLGLLTLGCLAGCQSIDPQPPKPEGFDNALMPAKSYVAGPLGFELNELEDKINSELDPVLVGKRDPGGKKGGLFPFRVARSGRVKIQYANGQLRLSTPLQLWIVKPFSNDKTPPERPFCSLDVRFQSPLTVTPNWRLASQIKFTDYEWVIKPEIRVLGQEISLASLAEDMLERYKPAIESAVDTAIYKELRLDKFVAPIWKNIQKPLLIDRNYGLWLLPKPVAVEASPITGSQTEIVSHLRITFETQTKLSLQKPTYTPTALPPLQKRDTLPAVSDLRLMSAIPYADINRVLDKALSEDAKKLALGTLRIKKVTVYGGQRSLVVKTDVSGLLNGTVYLRGRPMFDTLTNTLMIQNLDFDTGTTDVMPKLIGSVIHKGMVKLLSQMLTISLGDEIAQFPAKISQAFNRGKAAKKTDLAIGEFRFRPEQVAIRPDEIQALIRVQSRVALQVREL